MWSYLHFMPGARHATGWTGDERTFGFCKFYQGFVRYPFGPLCFVGTAAGGEPASLRRVSLAEWVGHRLVPGDPLERRVGGLRVGHKRLVDWLMRA